MIKSSISTSQYRQVEDTADIAALKKKAIQRDTEIGLRLPLFDKRAAILVSMLKQHQSPASTPSISSSLGVTPTYLPQNNDRSSVSLTALLPSTAAIHHRGTAKPRSTSTAPPPHTPLSAPILSTKKYIAQTDRVTNLPSNNGEHTTQSPEEVKIAFEQFKAIYPNTPFIDSQKLKLKQKYSVAKSRGDEANRLKSTISHLKSQIEKTEIHRLSDPDYSDAHHRRALEEARDTYRGKVLELKEMKQEIEHLHHLLDLERVKIQKAFEVWLRTCSIRQGWATPPPPPIHHRHPPNPQPDTLLSHSKTTPLSPPSSTNSSNINLIPRGVEKQVQSVKALDPCVEDDLDAFYRAKEAFMSTRTQADKNR